ncbi:MAG TPA: hypothetical protein VGG75_12115 [Trebonia sp.]
MSGTRPDVTGPARNRVTPAGDIVAAAGRGAWMGNRGRLHEGAGTRDIVRDHQGRAWLVCSLSFRGRRVTQWDPRHYTPLFLLDEAVAFAAGHRPCAECRHASFLAFADAWAAALGGARPRAPEIDLSLRAERLRDRQGRRTLTEMPWTGLPDGVFVMAGPDPAVVSGGHLARYDRLSNTYGPRGPRPAAGTALVLTPPSAVAVLRAGYPVQIGG